MKLALLQLYKEPTILQSQSQQSEQMWNKTHSQSNEETEDGEQEDRENNVKLLLEENIPIIDVWSHNFEEQLSILSALAQTYNVIAFDTEFPGNFVKKHTLTPYYNQEEIEYQYIWHNVEHTKLIQIGLTIADLQGNLPAGVSTWQFHLEFDLARENIVNDSIKMLKQAGIDFQKLKDEGIPQRRFAEALFSSGLILNKNIKWIVFHGCYDFGYLLRQLRAEPLPKTAEEFYKSVRIYFPNIYDIKHIVKDEDEFKQGGLNNISEKIGCARIGPKHQAGSDSLLTLKSYFRLRKILGDQHFQERANAIFGISSFQKANLGYSQLSFSQQYSQFNLYGYLNYNSSYQMPYYPYSRSGFEKQWPH